ncbi:hypothetical protein [Pseudomonas sp. GW460-C8]|uniref:hypothetical protein n=1 Tax=Pseudomonas sp. GW460-C8 TaxID=2070589 RepID=UPI0011AED7DA|nr:hypothetical protein [Pseudomonas sp. GW460-C8]
MVKSLHLLTNHWMGSQNIKSLPAESIAGIAPNDDVESVGGLAMPVSEISSSATTRRPIRFDTPDDRARGAYAMRQNGCTYCQIASFLGVSTTRAQQLSRKGGWLPDQPVWYDGLDKSLPTLLLSANFTGRDQVYQAVESGEIKIPGLGPRRYQALRKWLGMEPVQPVWYDGLDKSLANLLLSANYTGRDQVYQAVESGEIKIPGLTQRRYQALRKWLGMEPVQPVWYDGLDKPLAKLLLSANFTGRDQVSQAVESGEIKIPGLGRGRYQSLRRWLSKKARIDYELKNENESSEKATLTLFALLTGEGSL